MTFVRPINVTVDFGGLDPADDEFASVEAFVEYLCDDDRTSFDWRHLNCLSDRTGQPNRLLRRALESWGLTLEERRPERRVRGFDRSGGRDQLRPPRLVVSGHGAILAPHGGSFKRRRASPGDLGPPSPGRFNSTPTAYVHHGGTEIAHGGGVVSRTPLCALGCGARGTGPPRGVANADVADA